MTLAKNRFPIFKNEVRHKKKHCKGGVHPRPISPSPIKVEFSDFLHSLKSNKTFKYCTYLKEILTVYSICS